MFGLSTSHCYGNGEVGVEEIPSICVVIYGYDNLQLSRCLARVFSQKHSSTYVGNMGIYSVGIESVYQIVQTSRTECLAGFSQKGLTHEILARHNCLYLVLTLRIPIMCKTHASLRGKLSCETPARTLLASIA